MFADIHPYTLSLIVHLFYLATYTAWDKTEKRLQMSNVLDVVFFRKSTTHTLNELNKILSLTGLTIIPFCYFMENTSEHLYLSLWSQIVHAVYSSWKYYGDKVPYISQLFTSIIQDLNQKGKAVSSKKIVLQGIKKVSIVAGVLSLLFLARHFIMDNTDSMHAVLGILVLLFGLIHFYTMEIDYKFVLNVRTTGNFTIIYALVAMVGLALYGTQFN
jgi:hypothetical protein